MSIPSAFVRNRGLRLHYRDTGPSDAPPVLLLHGGRDHCRNWDGIVPALAQKWRVITPDLRGHGDSDHSPDGHYPMDAFVADLDAFVEALALNDIRLVGHSLGGNIAIRYAAVRPGKVSHLVAIEGLGPAPHLRRARDDEPIGQRMADWLADRRQAMARAHRRYPSIADAAARMARALPKLDQDEIERLTRHGVSRNADGTFNWKFDTMLWADPAVDLDSRQMESLWRSITAPVLLIYGGRSWASNPERDGRAANFRNVTVLIYEEAGHWVHYDCSDRFETDLANFLNGSVKGMTSRWPTASSGR